MKMRTPRRKSKRDRGGMVSVEFALTAPILFLLFMGAIEFSRANMLMHTTAIAATEGARRGIIAGATASDVENAVRAELSAIGITNADIVIEPPVITNDTDLMAVGVGVPVDASNGYFIPRFFLGKKFVKSASMTREAKRSDKNAEKAKKAAKKVEDAARQNNGNGNPSGT